MEKLKVYLSKSKSGNPDELMTVRHLLKHPDIELLEFMGGTYSDFKLKESNIVLVLSPNNSDYNIGRGQYEEVKYCLDSNKPVYLIYSSLRELSPITGLEYTGIDWKSEYGKVEVNENIDMKLDPEELKYIYYKYSKDKTLYDSIDEDLQDLIKTNNPITSKKVIEEKTDNINLITMM